MGIKTQLEAIIEENEELKARVHNLNLYVFALHETVVSPDQWEAFEKKFSGLGGYSQKEAEEEWSI